MDALQHIPTAAALDDFTAGIAAMARRTEQLGARPMPGDDDIADHDRVLFGRPVRIEVDVCVPLADLKKHLNTARAQITNALLTLEREGLSAAEKRFTVHRCLQFAKTYIYTERVRLRGGKLR